MEMVPNLRVVDTWKKAGVRLPDSEVHRDQDLVGRRVYAIARACPIMPCMENHSCMAYSATMIEIASLDDLIATMNPGVRQSVVCRVDGEYLLAWPKARVAGEVVTEAVRRRKLVEVTRGGGVWALRAVRCLIRVILENPGCVSKISFVQCRRLAPLRRGCRASPGL